MYTKRLRQGFREKFQTGIGLLLLVFIIHSVTLVADQSLGTDRLELPWAVGETVVDTVGEIGLNNTPMMMATTILVPQDQPTIQAGIDAAQDGDTVLVSPGTYFEELYIADKTITLASEFHTTGDESFIEQTIIDGQGALAVILVDQSVGPDTAIIGFTIQNGDDGIRPTGKLNILNNRLIGHNDAVDYEGGGGLLSNNYFEFNNDDAIDLDGSTDVIIEGNTILNSGNDGIEFRLHEYSGPTLNVIIRNNFIYGNAGDGIQLIDYPDVSDRLILIEGNLIENNDMAGLGLMDNGETAEDFRAASIPERIHLFNNTFIDNPYGVTGGDNLIALNNLFLNATVLAVKEIDGDSIAAFNLFWNNNVDNQGSNVDDNTTLYVNPFLDGTYQLPPASPAIDAGTAQYTLANDEVVLDLPSSTYSGLAPDLGAYESVAASANYQPLVEAGADLIVTLPNPILLAGYVFDDGLPTPPGVITTTWSQSSGPGTAVFADPSLVNTTITVSEVGLYVLRLTADDGEFVVFDEMSLTVVDGSAEITTIESRISSSADDAEESDTGLISLDSSDLELVADDSRGDQTVGLRFDNLFIPQGANIITATLQFQADEVTEEQTDLFIQGEASDNALPFVNTAGNISDRSMTTTTIPWSPEAWLNQGDVGPDQQVPDITAVIQEIVDRPGWAEGNALALIISGTGTRIADSFDGNQAGAPLLHIEFGSGTTNSNNPPVAADDSVTTIEASPITFDVTNNDSDPDGNLDTASVNTGCSGCFEPGNGNLVNHGDGSFTYSPDLGFIGSDSLRYEICDSETLCDTAVVNITVTPSSTLLFEVRVDNSEDDAEESNSGSMSLSSTDLEIVYESGQSAQKVGLRFDNIDIPQGATIVNATIQFQVDENDSEQTDLTIQGEATDDALAFTFESDNISERLLTNSAVAWAPAPWSTVGEAGPDQQTTNIASLIQEIVNRPGWEAGNALAVIITGSGKRVAESFDGSETAAPLLQIEYSIGSTTSNSSPVATDDSVTTAEETPVTFDVTNNDSDPDGNLDAASAHNTCSGCSEPDNGTLVNEGDGSFTYTPDTGFNGSDSFVYEICDTENLCDTAVVNITVTSVNESPTAVDDYATTPEETLVTINVSGNDDDPDGNLNAASANTNCGSCSEPDNGSLANNGDGSFTYSPDANFNGIDTFVYEICDAEGLCDTAVVTITVTAVGNPPNATDDSAITSDNTAVLINVTTNDTDPDGNLDPSTANTSCGACITTTNGTLINHGDGSFTYSANAAFSGVDSFTYEVCDTTGLCDTAVVTITVTAMGTTTIEVRIAASADDAEENETGKISLDSSDLELVVDNYSNQGIQTVGLRFNELTIPQGATIVNATIQFQADETSSELTNLIIAGERVSNASSFSKATGDISSRTQTAATVAWAPGPWLIQDEAGPNQQTPDIAAILEEIVSQQGWATGNSLVIMLTGSGRRVAEAYDGLATAAALLQVEYAMPVPQPPTAVDDSAITALDTAVLINVTTNDSDPDGNLDPSTANTNCAACATPTNGSLTNNGDGSFTYTPNVAFSGEDSFVYEVCDTTGLCDTAVVTITVASVGTTTIEVRITASTDDAEEGESGSMSLDSTDLELVVDNFTSQGVQTVGLRFNGLTIPQGATIVNATIQFQADETTSDPTNLMIEGELAENAAPFVDLSGNISSRALTNGSISWAPAPWLIQDEAGTNQQTPDIAAIIEEIVGQPGWQEGNSLVIIITRNGRRVAEAFDGDATAAPLLRIEFIAP